MKVISFFKRKEKIHIFVLFCLIFLTDSLIDFTADNKINDFSFSYTAYISLNINLGDVLETVIIKVL